MLARLFVVLLNVKFFVKVIVIARNRYWCTEFYVILAVSVYIYSLFTMNTQKTASGVAAAVVKHNSHFFVAILSLLAFIIIVRCLFHTVCVCVCVFVRVYTCCVRGAKKYCSINCSIENCITIATVLHIIIWWYKSCKYYFLTVYGRVSRIRYLVMDTLWLIKVWFRG